LPGHTSMTAPTWSSVGSTTSFSAWRLAPVTVGSSIPSAIELSESPGSTSRAQAGSKIPAGSGEAVVVVLAVVLVVVASPSLDERVVDATAVVPAVVVDFAATGVGFDDVDIAVLSGPVALRSVEHACNAITTGTARRTRRLRRRPITRINLRSRASDE
jgi:hypothetical protein